MARIGKHLAWISSLLILIILIIGLLVFSRDEYPSLEPRILSKHFAELLGSSDTIVVGSVIDEEMLQRELTITSGDRVRLQEIDIAVEKILKGDSVPTRISFYRYRWYADRILESPPIDPIMPGERSVFFLEKDDGYLRAALDVTFSRVKLWSGTHDYASLAGRSLAEQIAFIMLTPGDDVPIKAFSETLESQAMDAIQLVGKNGTLRLLRMLLSHESDTVAQSACLTLAGWFDGQSMCLAPFKATGMSGADARSIGLLLEEDEKRAVALADALRRGQIPGEERVVVGGRDAGVCDYLTALTAHQNQKVAALASRLLESRFPSAKTGCPSILE